MSSDDDAVLFVMLLFFLVLFFSRRRQFLVEHRGAGASRGHFVSSEPFLCLVLASFHRQGQNTCRSLHSLTSR